MENADCRLSVSERSSQTPVGCDVRYHDHGVVEAQGSTSFRADPVDAIQKRGVQHRQGENNVKSVEGAVEYVRKMVDYKQGVFDA